MSQIADAVAAYKAMGLSCSQTVMSIVGLDARDEENEDLVTAMCGLSYGMFCQPTCGALTGAACALALHAPDKETLKGWCQELSAWFEGRYSSVVCRDLLGEGTMNPHFCLEVIRETTEKSMEILEQAGCL